MRRDPVPGVRPLDELVGREERVRQAFGVDVVQGDLERPVQLLVRAQVREDPPVNSTLPAPMIVTFATPRVWHSTERGVDLDG